MDRDELAERLGQALDCTEVITPAELDIAKTRTDRALETILDPSSLRLLYETSQRWGIPVEAVLSDCLAGHQHAGPSRNALFAVAEFGDI